MEIEAYRTQRRVAELTQLAADPTLGSKQVLAPLFPLSRRDSQSCARRGRTEAGGHVGEHASIALMSWNLLLGRLCDALEADGRWVSDVRQLVSLT